MLAELNASPFGRNLHMLCHRLPRTCKAGQDWELERGFHLEVVGPDLFKLTLAAREASPEQQTLRVGPTVDSDSTGQVCLLIWQWPGQYDPSKFEGFASVMLVGHKEYDCGLILSHSSECPKAVLDYPRYRSTWKIIDKPVIQVFQDFPSADYFTVEKNLFDLGRIGRRLTKMGKIRRLMPW